MGGGIPEGGDLTVGLHDSQFTAARCAGSSDWFVHAKFEIESQKDTSLRASFGHGSPFVYFQTKGANATFRWGEKPVIWAGDEKSPALGVSVRGHHYGVFKAKNSQWKGLDGITFSTSGKANYCSVALLPNNRPETLALFANIAHNHITDTQVTYETKAEHVAARYQVTLKAMEKGEEGTILALYPHQWKYSSNPLTDLSYPSVRGEMKILKGNAFETKVPIHGLLPTLPREGIADADAMKAFLKEESKKFNQTYKDTYWEGKDLGKWSSLAGIADLLEETEIRNLFLTEIKTRLESWFTTHSKEDAPLFFYEQNWGTLIGSKPAYGSDNQINDHHFHYGYFIRAAAEIARWDPAWARKWTPMVELLIRDIASNDRNDPLFPYTRCFDWYAGHSWASGHADFGDGNNQESSSESLNAWYGLMLWGEATGNQAIRDKGLFLFQTERTAIEEYWFDVSGNNFPENYPHQALGMVWGGKGAYATWFSGDLDCIHGINWLPFTPASLYLGRSQEYVGSTFRHLLDKRKGGSDLNTGWGDLLLMFGALEDPPYAADSLKKRPQSLIEAGNSSAFLHHWVGTLNILGQPVPQVTANHPFATVFQKENRKTYAAYNYGKKPLKVTFSDGFSLEALPQQLTTAK